MLNYCVSRFLCCHHNLSKCNKLFRNISAILFHFPSSYWNKIKTSSDLDFNGRLDKQQIVSPGLNINNVLDYQNKEKYLLLQTYETEAIIVLKLPSLQY